MTLSRRSFIGRALGVGAALALPGLAPAAPPQPMSVVEPPVPVRPPWRRPPLLNEWWFESEIDDNVKVELWKGAVNVETHIVPPRSGVYMQFPLGREPELPDSIRTFSLRDRTEVRTVGISGLERHDRKMPRPEEKAATGQSIHGHFGFIWEE